MNKILRKKIIILGYSESLSGGVVSVTDVLLKNMPELELHAVLHCYVPKLKSVLLTVSSFFSFSYKISTRRREYSAIHVIIGSSGDALRTIPFIWMSKLFRLKVIIQFHKSADIIFKGIKYNRLCRYIDKLWGSVDVLAFLSKRLSSLHNEYFGSVKNSIIIPNALEQHWLNTEVRDLGNRTKDIVFFGRWSWEKGVDDLVSAMDKLNIECNCELYTDAPAEASFNRCIFNPWVSEKEVQEIISTAKLLVLPSYSEAYPTVLLEAAACGTPFVATDIAGIPDIVSASEGGITIRPGDVDSLASHIEKLLLDEILWEKLSKNGKAWSATLGIETIAMQWRDAYSKI